MQRKLAFVLVIYFTLFMSVFHYVPTSQAEHIEQLNEEMIADIERTKQLLQKGLTLYEMEQEIERLTNKEVAIEIEIENLERDIASQQQLVAVTKEQAGQVLRSYYLGERDSLWLIILSLNSFSEALAALEFISNILGSDHKRLQDYATAYKQLQQLLALSEETRTNLQQVKLQFIQQRDAQLVLQQELDSELEQREDADNILDQIKQLTAEWEQKGLPVFRQYLQAFAEAMEHLPNIQSMYSNVLTLKGASIQFRITDEQLNGFLAEQNPILENLLFQFGDEQVQAGGQHDEMTMTITGQFVLELEPLNAIRFHIEQLLYNDFELPESTVIHLQEQFAFSFYPEQLSFLGLTFKATELNVASGQLTVILGF